jgi:glycosyltransferase involved in cell wall biosynthesis
VRFLILSWFFPPWNEVACGRPYSWARHFVEQGHAVTVLTPVKDERVHGSLTFPLDPHPNLRVVETPLVLRRLPKGKAVSWTLANLRSCAALARRSDIVISTYPYGHAHTLGRVAKLANPRAFWCADYRDLWHDNYFFTAGKPLRRSLLRRVERMLVRPAELSVTVSEPLADRLRRTHPHIPCAVVYNGFQERDYREPQPETRLRQRAQAGVPFRILYTGTLYRGGYQDPEPLFAALAARSWVRPVKVTFYGPSAREIQLTELRERYQLQTTIELPTAHLSRSESLAAQREADLLLHLGWTDPGNDGWLSGKVFEYMAAGNPILSVGAEAGTAIGRLLAHTGTGICVGRDVAQIGDALNTLINRGEHCPWYRPQEPVVRGFSREAQAAGLLSRLMEGWRVREAAKAGRGR